MLVNVAHEEVVAVFGGEGICQIEASSAMRREVGVVADRLDGRIGVGVEVGAGLFVVDAALDDVEEVGDDATGGKAVAEIIDCLLYTSPSPRDLSTSRMPSSA